VSLTVLYLLAHRVPQECARHSRLRRGTSVAGIDFRQHCQGEQQCDGGSAQTAQRQARGEEERGKAIPLGLTPPISLQGTEAVTVRPLANRLPRSSLAWHSSTVHASAEHTATTESFAEIRIHDSA
jgi:hypothetical protein